MFSFLARFFGVNADHSEFVVTIYDMEEISFRSYAETIEDAIYLWRMAFHNVTTTFWDESFQSMRQNLEVGSVYYHMEGPTIMILEEVI